MYGTPASHACFLCMGARTHKSDPPTIDRLRADISRGRTGDKVAFPDPAAAPLGTDDEAADRPATQQELRLEERARPPLLSPRPPSGGPVMFYLSFGALLATVIVMAAWFLR